ncbi:zinc transporter ZupT [Arcanobacterium hippocoleae]
MNTFTIAFILTLLAGLATGVGSALAFFTKRTSPRFLAISLGFSAGVMLYVSFIEIIPKARESLVQISGETAGAWQTVIAFFLGIAIIGLIDFFVPDYENPHEMGKEDKFQGVPGQNSVIFRPGPDQSAKLMRMGLFTAAALAIHNFPEGFATFLAGMHSADLALPIAIAIAIHNIPEGIAVSVPIFYATGSRKKAFWLSFASGLSEPLGALIGWMLLSNFMGAGGFGWAFAAVAGIMVYISLDELLPTAEEYGQHHHAIIGLITGMAIMAISLLLL